MRSLLYVISAVFLHSGSALFAQEQEKEIIRSVDKDILDAEYTKAMARIENLAEETPSLLLLNKKAELLTRMGNLRDAESILEYIRTAVALNPSPFVHAMTEMNQGFLQLNQGRSDQAEETLQKAVRRFEDANESKSSEAAQAHAHLGIVYMSQGRYSQAQEQLHRALSLRSELDNNKAPWIAATYNDLGLVYSQTDKEKALQYFEDAKKMYATLYGARHPKTANAHINTGILYRDLELFDDALIHFETALDIWKEVYPEPHAAKAIALYNLGQTYVQLRDHARAKEYYHEALRMYEAVYGRLHPENALVLNALGNLHVAARQFDEALAAYQQALQANVPGFVSDDFRANPAFNNYYNGARLLHTLLFKAQAFEARYSGKTLKFADLQEALRILTACDSLIDQLRQHSTHESDKLLLGAMASEVYTDGVRIAYEAALNAIKKETYLETAFHFSEKSKSAVLLESIVDAEAKSFAGIPLPLLEDEKKIKAALTFNAQKLSLKPSPEEEQLLREHSFTLRRRYDTFIQDLEKRYPEYFNLKYNSSVPSIKELQQLIGPETAVISYAVDEKNSRLYIFLVRKNGFRIWQRTLPVYFEKYLTGLRNSLYFEEINTFRISAYALGRTLLPRIPSSVKDLIILPTGQLSLIPFETLLLQDAENMQDYTALPYLLNRYSVRYEFSAGLLFQKSQKKLPEQDPASIFLCAPVNFGEQQSLRGLPGTEKEVHEISKLFASKNLTAAEFLHDEANEQMIKTRSLADYKYVHFATHGVVDELQPERSRIFLQAGSSDEDGDLFAGEIYNLELSASLVTLSACQTGLGKVIKGEGVMGLSRALVYAGAQNIVVSFWNVADESTAMLMKEFYTHALQSPVTNFSQNLRDAKLTFINNPKYAAPFYWAPFVLIGY